MKSVRNNPNHIYIDDPENKLSPEYKVRINIEGENSDNIVSYTYAGLVPKNTLARLDILKSNPRQAGTIAKEYLNEKQKKVFISGLYYSLNFMSQSQKRHLIETGDSNLVYNTDNVFLRDIVGKVYMDFRQYMKNQIKKEIVENKNTLKLLTVVNEVYKKLLDLIVSGKSNLKKYEDRQPLLIAEELKIDYERVMFTGPSEEGKKIAISDLLSQLKPFLDLIPDDEKDSVENVENPAIEKIEKALQTKDVLRKVLEKASERKASRRKEVLEKALKRKASRRLEKVSERKASRRLEVEEKKEKEEVEKALKALKSDKKEVQNEELAKVVQLKAFQRKEALEKELQKKIRKIQTHYRNIAYFLRKKYGNVYEEISSKRFKNSLVDLHIGSIVKNDPHAREEFLRRIGIDGFEELKNRFEILYLTGNMPHLPMDLAPEPIGSLVYNPIDNNYTEIKRVIEPGYNADKIFNVEIEPIYMEIEKTRQSKMVYLTPLHYAYARMIEELNMIDNFGHLVKHTDTVVHSIISRYVVLDDLPRLYKSVYKNHITATLNSRLFNSLRQKFSNEPFRSFLLLTKPKILIYDSPDQYLGIGKFTKNNFTGENQVGQMMMKIRNEIKGDPIPVQVEEKRAKETMTQILDRVFEGQRTDNLKDWLMNQTKEMMNVVINLKVYLREKVGVNNTMITPEEIVFVIENIYSLCHVLEKIIDIEMFKNIMNAGIPTDYETELNSILTTHNFRISQSGMKKLWGYILILILSIKKDGELSIRNFDTDIRRVASKKFKDIKCTRETIYDVHDLGKLGFSKTEIEKREYKNCIYQASVLLLDKLRNFSYIFSKDSIFTVENMDIDLVYNIMSYYAGKDLPPIVLSKNSDHLTIYNNLSKKFNISLGSVKYFSNMIETLSNQPEETKQRVIYFAEQEEEDKAKKKDKKKEEAKEKEKQKEEEKEKPVPTIFRPPVKRSKAKQTGPRPTKYAPKPPTDSPYTEEEEGYQSPTYYDYVASPKGSW